MVPNTILRYIQGPDALAALDAGFAFAEREMNWSVAGRAEMYQIADRAFGVSPNYDSFCRLYEWKMQYWGIGRKGIMASPQAVFAMLTDGCASASRHTSSTLLTADRKVIRNSVNSMELVKRVGEYPHMAASKFLHFYNPMLFPIYDNAVIWERVLHGAFLPEWKVVCREYGIKVWEPSEEFLKTYYCWASEVMKVADPAIMVAFEKRFMAAVEPDGVAPMQTNQYYGAAFEYLFMGASMLRRSA